MNAVRFGISVLSDLFDVRKEITLVTGASPRVGAASMRILAEPGVKFRVSAVTLLPHHS
jgi:hypothetical protein